MNEQSVKGPIVAAVVSRKHRINMDAKHLKLIIESDEPIIFLDEVQVAKQLLF
jgi:hypothetical protein